MLQLRPFTPDLLDRAVILWNLTLGSHYPMRPALLRQGLWSEPNFDPHGSRAAFVADQMVGFIGVKRQQVAMGNQPARSKGWVSVLVVDPAHQGQGIGSALLSHAREHLAGYSDEPVSLGGDTGHFFPGIPLECRPALDWFARRGARLSGPVCDLANTAIAAFAHPPAVLETLRREAGVTFRPATLADYEGLRGFLSAEFPDRWAWEIDEHIEKGGRPEDVMLALEGERVIGFARIHTPESTRFGPGTYWAPAFFGRHGGLGPIGVAKDVRGRGLGLALLSSSLAELRDRGIESAVIDWTGLVPFYGRVGFRPWRWYIGASIKPGSPGR